MNNQKLLLDVALKLFSERGYDGVGVQEIVDLAQVTKPTLYHYFSSKRGLLDALLRKGFMPFLGTLKAAAQYEGDLTRSLEKVIRLYFNFAKEQPDFYRMQLGMHFAPYQSDAYTAVALYGAEQTKLIEALFRAAEKDHGNMRGRAAQYGASFLGMLNTYINLAINHQIELDDSLVYKVLHQFMHGIFS